MSKRALVIVDLQHDYLSSGKFPLVGIEQVVANAASTLADARFKHIPVFHIRHEFTQSDAPFFAPGSTGAQIISAVAPRPGESNILKHHPNAFLHTDLQTELEAQGITDITVIGAMSHMCIDATVRAAADLGYKVTVLHDACATRDLEFKGQTTPASQVQTAMMAALAFAYATVMGTSEYLQA